MNFKYDPDLDLMTLILKLDLDMVKMYLYSENEIHSVAVQKFQPEQTDTQTDRQTDLIEIITCPHTWKVIILK